MERTILLNENQFSEIVNGFGRRYVLSEGLSSRLYHFCSLSFVYGIVRSGKINLSFSSNAGDAYSTEKRFYLSCSRSSNAFNEFFKKYECRIELDGDKLHRDGYSGRPLNYFSGIMSKSNSFFEYEDRLFSSSPTINDAYKYIARIDILLSTHNAEMVRKIVSENEEGLPIFAYTNRIDFNYRKNPVDFNSDEFREFCEKADNDGFYSVLFSDNDDNCREIVLLLMRLYFYGEYYYGSFPSDEIGYCLKGHGLSMFYDYVEEHFLDRPIYSFRDLAGRLRNSRLRFVGRDNFEYGPKIQGLCSVIFNEFGVKSLDELIWKSYDKTYSEIASDGRKMKERNRVYDSVKCVYVEIESGEQYVIEAEGADNFWNLLWFNINQSTRSIMADQLDLMLYRKGYSFKSRDEVSFSKYIHRMFERRIAVDDFVKFINSIGLSQEEMTEVLGVTKIETMDMDIEKFKEYRWKFMDIDERDDVAKKLGVDVYSI